MAFVVEDGTGTADANSYSTVAAFKSYADDKGTSYSGFTDPQIEAALVRATAYIDGVYRNQFQGVRQHGRSQALEFPRSGVWDSEGWAVASDAIPTEIARATQEGAIRELASAGALNPDIKAGGGIVKRVKAGSVEVEYESNLQTQKTFQAIEQALGRLLIVRASYSGAAARA